MPSTVSWAAKVRAAAERPDASHEPSLGINQLHLNGERDLRAGQARQQQHHYTQQHEQPYQGYVGMRLHTQLAAPVPGAVGAAPLSSTPPQQQQQQQHYLNGAVGGLALPPHHLGLLGLSLGSAVSSNALSSSSSSAIGSSAVKAAPAAAVIAADADFGEELPAQFGQHLPLELPGVAGSGGEAKEDLLGTFPCVKLRGLALEASVKDVLDFFVGLGPVLDIVLQPMDPRRTTGGEPAAEAVVLFGNILDYRGALQVSYDCRTLHFGLSM
jgi:hypothetical protein